MYDTDSLFRRVNGYGLDEWNSIPDRGRDFAPHYSRPNLGAAIFVSNGYRLLSG